MDAEWEADLARLSAEQAVAREQAVAASAEGGGLVWKGWGRDNHVVAYDGEIIGTISPARTLLAGHTGPRTVLSYSASPPTTGPLPSEFPTVHAAVQALSRPYREAGACRNPLCTNTIEAHALGRRRLYCGDACRQAMHRLRERARADALVTEMPDSDLARRGGPDEAELERLDEGLTLLAKNLLSRANLLDEVADLTDQFGTVLRTSALTGLTELLDQFTRLAVARDRAAGASWSSIGAALELHPDTARDRYHRRAAETRTP